MSKGTATSTVGTKYKLFSSYYVDDAAYIFLNREDLEKAAKLIKAHFRRFGFTVHCGDTRTNEKSKTEAMFIPAPDATQADGNTTPIMLNDYEYFGFCSTFKYLGTTFDPQLDDTTDVSKRIQKSSAAFAAMRKVLRCKDIPAALRLRTYEATVLNILLFGCESWALTQDDINRLESTHHRFLRSMCHISIQQVQQDRITNKQVRQRLGCHTLQQRMELRRAWWLEKIVHMTEKRNPRKTLVTWTPYHRPVGRPQQTVRRSYAMFLQKTLQFPATTFKEWWHIAIDPTTWANRVETSLQLPTGTYTKFKYRMYNF